jgi:hypothetical protein
MRLTVNLDEDLYAIARSLAQAEDCTISAAVNRLVRRSLEGAVAGGTTGRRQAKRNGFVVSRGRVPVTADVVRTVESENDDA